MTAQPPKPPITREQYYELGRQGYFDGKRVDVLTEGGAVEAGEMVRCIEVRAGRVIVRRVDPIGMNRLENDPTN